jgi:integrase
MSENLEVRAAEHLAIRHALGYRLSDHQWLIRDFLDYLSEQDSPTITVTQALVWACIPTGTSQRWWRARLAVIRPFAAYVHACDASSAELIPTRLLRTGSTRRSPFLYAPEQIQGLMRQARGLRPVVCGQTMTTIIGLMAATGMRVGEALALDTCDIDMERGTVLVTGKGGAKRLLPVHATTVDALTVYLRDSRVLRGTWPDEAVFVNLSGNRPLRNNVEKAFRTVAAAYGIPSEPDGRKPRLHDLRHTFAVNALTDAYRSGLDANARVAALVTYLGHVRPASTYWYLTASAELLQLASNNVENQLRGELP